MSKVDHTRLQPINGNLKLGHHALGVSLLDVASSYKKNVAKRYRLVTAEEISTRIRERELLCSKKIDGQFSYLYKDQDEIFVFNYSGRVITDLPFFAKAQETLKDFDSIVIAGELYYKADKTTRASGL